MIQSRCPRCAAEVDPAAAVCPACDLDLGGRVPTSSGLPGASPYAVPALSAPLGLPPIPVARSAAPSAAPNPAPPVTSGADVPRVAAGSPKSQPSGQLGPLATPVSRTPASRPAGTTGSPTWLSGLLADRSKLVAAIAVVVALALGVGWLVSLNPGEGAPVIATSRTVQAQAGTAPSQAADPVGAVHCWDGSTTSDLAGCSEPELAAGIRYVYPDYDARGSCAYKDYREGRTVTFDCDLGGKKMMRYRWWRDTDEAVAHYKHKFAKGTRQPLVAAGQTIGTLYRDTKPVGGVYRMSAFFRDHFSFTIEAKTRREQNRLLGLLVIRNPDDFTGYPQDTGPKGTVHVS